MDWGDFSRIEEDVLADFLATPMPTALIRTYTKRGFVVAADGRSTDSTTGRITSESVQKIYQMARRPLALSFTGAARIGVSDDPDADEVLVDFIAELSRAGQVTSPKRFQSFQDYVARIARTVQERLANALPRRTGPLPSIPSAEPDDYGETILIALLDGYHDGRPGRVRLRFCHDGRALLEPHILTERLIPGRYTFYGISEIGRRLNVGDESLGHYFRDFEIDKFYTPELVSAIKFCQAFVDACGGPEAALIDPERAAAIGGHTHVAVITPERGFQWAIEPIASGRK